MFLAMSKTKLTSFNLFLRVYRAMDISFLSVLEKLPSYCLIAQAYPQNVTYRYF